MTIFDIFQSSLKPKSKSKPIITSRPIFQFSSSFIDSDHDDIDLEKQTIRRPIPTSIGSGQHPRDAQQTVTERSAPTAPYSSLILHLVNTILSLISLSLFITAIPLWNANFEHTRSLVSGDYTDGLLIAPLLLSLSSSMYILLICHARLTFRFSTTTRTSKTYTTSPRTKILIALTILLTLAPALTLSATNSLALVWQSAQPTKSGLVLCNLANVFARECQPTLYLIGSLQISGVVLGGVVWFVWAWFFFVAVREWMREKRMKDERRHERRHERRRRRRARDVQGHVHNASRVKGVEREGSRMKGSGHRSHAHKHHRENKNSRGVLKPDQALNATLQPGESSAARLASSNVKPKETIQAWLADRYA